MAAPLLDIIKATVSGPAFAVGWHGKLVAEFITSVSMIEEASVSFFGIIRGGLDCHKHWAIASVYGTWGGQLARD